MKYTLKTLYPGLFDQPQSDNLGELVGVLRARRTNTGHGFWIEDADGHVVPSKELDKAADIEANSVAARLVYLHSKEEKVYPSKGQELAVLRACAQLLKVGVESLAAHEWEPGGSVKWQVVFGWDGTSQETWEELFDTEEKALAFGVATQADAMEQSLYGKPTG